MNETESISYSQAIKALKKGFKVRLPEWTGYWFYENDKIWVFTRTGDILDTPMHDEFKKREDWELVTDGLGFDFAILALKAGKLLQRDGWNGKNQFIFIRPGDQLTPKFIYDTVKSYSNEFKEAIMGKFRGETHYAGGEEIKVKFTPYICLFNAQGEIVNGWVPSMGDLFATDWQIFQF